MNCTVHFFILMFLCQHLYPHDQHSLQAIGQWLYCIFGCKPITHVEQTKWPMADFHLGQHPLFRKHAYTVTCHPAPGAPQRPTLPLRGGPPFCSVLKMISMHEFSWGAMSSSLYRAFQFGCLCGWVPATVHLRCVHVRERLFSSVFPNGSFARFRSECDWKEASDAFSVSEGAVHCLCGEHMQRLKLSSAFTGEHTWQHQAQRLEHRRLGLRTRHD